MGDDLVIDGPGQLGVLRRLCPRQSRFAGWAIWTAICGVPFPTSSPSVRIVLGSGRFSPGSSHQAGKIMASWGVCLLSLTLICNIIAGCDFSFVNLKCNDYKQERLGQQSLLECIVNLSQGVPDARIERVFWMKEGATLIEYERGDLTSKPRFTLAEPYWNEDNLNVSMLVTNTMLGDVGNYMCTVITNRGYCLSSASLELSATYSSPTTGVTENNQKVTMPSCDDGGCDTGKLLDEHAPNPGSQLASKVVPSVVVVLVIIGLLFFLIKRCDKRTHEEIPMENHDLCNGEPNHV